MFDFLKFEKYVFIYNILQIQAAEESQKDPSIELQRSQVFSL